MLVPFCSWAKRPNDKKNKKKAKQKVYILYECVRECVSTHVHMLELYECKFHLEEEEKKEYNHVLPLSCVYLYGNKNVHWTEKSYTAWFVWFCFVLLVYGIPSLSLSNSVLVFLTFSHTLSPSFTLFVVLILPRLSINFRRSKTKTQHSQHIAKRNEEEHIWMAYVNSESLWNRFRWSVSEWVSE